MTAVLLNWLTTGDHLIRSLSQRHLWPIAGVDLLLLATAAIAALAALRLRQRHRSSAGYERRVPSRAAV